MLACLREGRQAMENDRIPAAPQASHRSPWNRGKLIGAKPPLRPNHVWSIRTKLQMADRKRDLALFNLAIGNKMREWCDEAGLPQCSAHGLRKAGAAIAAERGATRASADGDLRLANAERGRTLHASGTAKKDGRRRDAPAWQGRNLNSSFPLFAKTLSHPS